MGLLLVEGLGSPLTEGCEVQGGEVQESPLIEVQDDEVQGLLLTEGCDGEHGGEQG